MTMRVLVLGAGEQVGFECAAVLRLTAEVLALTRGQLDITDSDALIAMLQNWQPDVVVNGAAYTNVQEAEAKEAQAHAVNARAVGILGEQAKKRRFGLIHFSTDYVFDGRKDGAYEEGDTPCPLNAYGRTKLEGERALIEADAPALILRTAWVYGMRTHNFVSTILRLARSRPVVSVVTDQRGNPTFCRDLAEAVALLSSRLQGQRGGFEAWRAWRGVYHLAGQGMCSRFELAQAVLSLDPRRSEHLVRHIVPITSPELASSVCRPERVNLNTNLAFERLGIRLPPWRMSLQRALAG